MSASVTLLPNVAIDGRNICGHEFGLDSLYLEGVVTSPIAYETIIPVEDHRNLVPAFCSYECPRSRFFFQDPDLSARLLHPIYRYEGWQWLSALTYRPWNQCPAIQGLHNALTSITIDGKLLQPVNHCIYSVYENDSISPHHDEVTTIQGNTYIFFAFGTPRELHFHWNKNKELRNPDVVLVPQPGSLVILGPKTNLAMKHSVPKTEYNKVLPKGEVDSASPGVSVVFRSSTKLMAVGQVLKAWASSERARNKRKRG